MMPTLLTVDLPFAVRAAMRWLKPPRRSGTSMSAPQVTNLAAKMLAVHPKLTPAELIAAMRATAERSEDGRRTLIHPARALASVGFKP